MEHNSVFDLNMLKYFQLLIKLILEIENSSNFIFMSINKILLNSSSNCSALHHLWTFESRVEKSPGLLSSEIPHVQEALRTLGPKSFLNRTWALFYVVLYNKKMGYIQVDHFQKVPFVHKFIEKFGRFFYTACTIFFKVFEKMVNKRVFLKIISL